MCNQPRKKTLSKKKHTERCTMQFQYEIGIAEGQTNELSNDHNNYTHQ